MKQLNLTLLAILTLLFFGKMGYSQNPSNSNIYKSAQGKTSLSASAEHRVVFMGNSITQGWSNIDPAFFAGKPYINSGISGQTTSQMLERFERDVVNFLPTVVVILAGTNDIAGNGGPTTVKRIQANIASMAQQAKTNGIMVVLCSVLPVYKYGWNQSVNPIDSISSLNSLIKTYAQENEMIYADFYSPMVNEQKGLKSQYSGDGVHPNLAGYRVMNPIVEEAIDKALILVGISQVINLKDITEQSGTITAQGEEQPNLKDYAIDNTVSTKWLDLANANPTTRASWIQYQLTGGSYVVPEYTITSAADFPDRDPKSWNLLGSNNGTEWITLDTKTNEVFSGRLQKKSYIFTNSVAFSYYKLQINSVNNPATATGVQLAELEILGIPAVTSVDLLPTVLNLDKNDIRQLYARVSPSNATPTLAWSSSNEAVATVSSTGLVTAKAAGTATITVTSANSNKTATCEVAVYNSGFTKFEAENATLSGISLVKDQPGYSGTGFVAAFGSTGNSVQFSITGASAGSQYITLRYATAVGASIHLYINGTMIRQVTLDNTGSWGGWTDKEDNVTLNAGYNTIKYQKDAGDGGHINVDYLAVRNIQTGISEIAKGENGISLFPNPLSTGSLLIKLPEDAIQLSVFDVTGKKVYQEKVIKTELLIGQSVFKSEGVYVVNVMTSTNSINKKLIIKK